MGCRVYVYDGAGVEVDVPWIRLPPAFYDKTFHTPTAALGFVDDLVAGNYSCGRKGGGRCGIGTPPILSLGGGLLASICCSMPNCGLDYASPDCEACEDGAVEILRALIRRMRDDGTFGRLRTG